MQMIYKTRHFNRWARKADLPDKALFRAVIEIRQGLVDADLGGGIIKKRIALPGHGKRGSTRTLLATNRNYRWVFVYGFEKNERANISNQQGLIRLEKSFQSVVQEARHLGTIFSL